MDPKETYRKILLKNEIIDEVDQVIVQDSGAKGDGMVSVTKRVTITFQKNRRPPLKLFVKLHTTDNPSHEKFIEDLKAFEKEARFFMEYLPAARQLCDSIGMPDLVAIYPKCYFGDDQMIVLEDLCEAGYEMIPFDNRHDLDTAMFAMKTLAKHHAISLAMMKAAGGERHFFKKFLNLDYDSHYPMIALIDTFDRPLGPNITILEKNAVDGKEEALELLNAFDTKSFGAVARNSFQFDKTGNPLFVLNHGDYKFNNMLFRLDPANGKILDHVAIDLQVTRYDTPGWDLSYYLFTTVDHTVRQKHLQTILETYVNTLNELTEKLGCPTALKYKDLLAQFKNKFEYAFWTCLTLIGPGQEIIKGMDIEKMDMIKIGELYHIELQKWIDFNPEQCSNLAKEIVSMTKEYKKLQEL